MKCRKRLELYTVKDTEFEWGSDSESIDCVLKFRVEAESDVITRVQDLEQNEVSILVESLVGLIINLGMETQFR